VLMPRFRHSYVRLSSTFQKSYGLEKTKRSRRLPRCAARTASATWRFPRDFWNWHCTSPKALRNVHLGGEPGGLAEKRNTVHYVAAKTTTLGLCCVFRSTSVLKTEYDSVDQKPCVKIYQLSTSQRSQLLIVERSTGWSESRPLNQRSL
jgi:hypothetical protein